MLQLYFILKIARESILKVGGHANPKTRREESEGERRGGGERERELREGERERVHARGRERERESTLAPLFICFFVPLGLPYANWASQKCCLFYLRSSLWSSDLPLTFLCSIFAGFSLPCLLATNTLGSYFIF